MKEFAVYKYVYEGRVVYVGKTNASLKARIDAHKREDSFKPYMAASVYYCELSNEVETDAVEKILINYYKPEINIKDKVPLLTEEAMLPNIEWHPYSDYKPVVVRINLAKKRALKAATFVDKLRESGGNEFTLPFLPEKQDFDGVPLADREVFFDGKEYHFTPTKEGVYATENSYYSLLFSMTSFLLPFIEKKERFSLISSFINKVKEYILGGYVTDFSDDTYSLFVESKYEPIMPLVKSVAGIEPRKCGDYYELWWGRDHDEYLSVFEEEKCYEFVKQARLEGLLP